MRPSTFRTIHGHLGLRKKFTLVCYALDHGFFFFFFVFNCFCLLVICVSGEMNLMCSFRIYLSHNCENKGSKNGEKDSIKL